MKHPFKKGCLAKIDIESVKKKYALKLYYSKNSREAALKFHEIFLTHSKKNIKIASAYFWLTHH